MFWFTIINFGLLIFLNIEPDYKLIWFIALWLLTVIKINKDIKNI